MFFICVSCGSLQIWLILWHRCSFFTRPTNSEVGSFSPGPLQPLLSIWEKDSAVHGKELEFHKNDDNWYSTKNMNQKSYTTTSTWQEELRVKCSQTILSATTKAPQQRQQTSVHTSLLTHKLHLFKQQIKWSRPSIDPKPSVNKNKTHS